MPRAITKRKGNIVSASNESSSKACEPLPKFEELVYQVVQQIPSGKVTSYGMSFVSGQSYRILRRKTGHIAKIIGRPRNARRVGQALRILPGWRACRETTSVQYPELAISNSHFVPWHRVVNGKGDISPRGSASPFFLYDIQVSDNYGMQHAAVRRQANMLGEEGVIVSTGDASIDAQSVEALDTFGFANIASGGRVSLRQYGWFPEVGQYGCDTQMVILQRNEANV